MKKLKKETYDQFLKKRHASMNTPLELIEYYVKKATGSKIASKKRLIVGESSEVYEITLSDNKEVIVRIASAENHLRFLPEKWAIEQCKNKNIPVPEILLVESFSSEGKNKEINIESKLKGIMLDELMKSLNLQKQRKYINECGRVLSEIHTIPTDGFGILDSNGMGQYKTNEDYVLKMRIESKEKYTEPSIKFGIKNYVLESLEYLRMYLNVYKNENSMMLHGDFTPQHIFFDGNRLTGVIDFENVCGGDPVRDIALWDYFYSSTTPYLIEGYVNKKIFNEVFNIKMHIYKLHMGLGFLYYYDYTNNHSGIEIVKKEFSNCLTYFKSL